MSRQCHANITSILLIWGRQHGSTDGVISIAEEDGLIAGYKATGVLYEQHELMGWGHGADAANVNDQSTGFKNVTQHDVQFEVRAKTEKSFLHICPEPVLAKVGCKLTKTVCLSVCLSRTVRYKGAEAPRSLSD
jgi:hypothetical protein